MVPEPERNEENEHIGGTIQVELDHPLEPDIQSSDEETGDEEDAAVDMNGYMPLPQLQNDEDTQESNQPQSSSSDEEADIIDEPVKDSDREIHVNQDLVMSAMKGVSLSGNCIPEWAKKLSQNEWDNIVKRTISGEEVLPKENPSS